MCVYLGFFGDLLTLVCQNFSMVDMVLLLHGQSQPLSRIQPQLAQFFSEHYLQGREPSEANIAVCSTVYFILSMHHSFQINIWWWSLSVCFFHLIFYVPFFKPKAAADNLIGELDEYITESFVSDPSHFKCSLENDNSI